MTKIYLALLFIITGLAPLQSAKAAFLIEPYGSYSSNGSYIPSTPPNFSFTGLTYGGRIGIDVNHILFGFDYMGNNDQSLDPSPPQPTNSYTSKDANLGAFIGINFRPYHFRLIGTYFIESDSEVVVTDANSGTKLSDLGYRGAGYKVGLFVTPIHFISLGVEYYNIVYSSQKDILNNGASYAAVSALNKSAVLFTLSIPIEIGAHQSSGKRRR